MSKEKECTALVKIESGLPVKRSFIRRLLYQFSEDAQRARYELNRALSAGEVKGPALAILVEAGIAAAVSAGQYLLTRAFAPKPPTQRKGEMIGSLVTDETEIRGDIYR